MTQPPLQPMSLSLTTCRQIVARYLFLRGNALAEWQLKK